MERIYEFNASKIRNIFYCDWNRKINLLHVFKTHTKVSLVVDFFYFSQNKKYITRCTLQSFAFQDT